MNEKEVLARIAGAEHVLNDEDTLQAFATDHSFVPSGRPSYVVRPGCAQEVQALVKWANEALEPLTPVSSPGGPRFHGDTIPSLGGVVVDLSRMNEIVNVDRRDKVAVVEPGVTWAQFEPELRKNGLRAIKPLLPRRTKSVVASCLEREPVVIPRDHWDAADPLACTEVVFGSGDLFRTGSAATPPMDLREQIQVGLRQLCPSGPSTTSFSRVLQGAQGTMGIVTWASVMCGILPEIEKPLFVGSERLQPLIDLTYRLTRRRLGEELFVLNGFHLASILADEPLAIRTLATELPAWVLVVNLTAHGVLPEERMAYQEQDVRDMAKALGVPLQSSVGGVSASALMKLQADPPEDYYKLRLKGGCHDVFFTTTMDRTPELIAEARAILEAQNFPTSELGVYVQPTVQGCNCHCELNMMYDPSDKREKAFVRNLDGRLTSALERRGAFFSRPYGAWADQAFSGNAESTALLKKVKQMFDPKGIMNPGKLCF